MAHIPESTTSADEHPLDVTADPGTQGDDLEGLAELSKNASPEEPARQERTIAVVAQSRRVRSITLKTVFQEREKLAPTK